MTEKSFMTVEEVAEELRVSKSKAYEIVRQLNADCASVECGIEAERISYRSGQGEHPVFPEKDLLQ